MGDGGNVFAEQGGSIQDSLNLRKNFKEAIRTQPSFRPTLNVLVAIDDRLRDEQRQLIGTDATIDPKVEKTQSAWHTIATLDEYFEAQSEHKALGPHPFEPKELEEALDMVREIEHNAIDTLSSLQEAQSPNDPKIDLQLAKDAQVVQTWLGSLREGEGIETLDFQNGLLKHMYPRFSDALALVVEGSKGALTYISPTDAKNLVQYVAAHMSISEDLDASHLSIVQKYMEGRRDALYAKVEGNKATEEERALLSRLSGALVSFGKDDEGSRKIFLDVTGELIIETFDQAAKRLSDEFGDRTSVQDVAECFDLIRTGKIIELVRENKVRESERTIGVKDEPDEEFKGVEAIRYLEIDKGIRNAIEKIKREDGGEKEFVRNRSEYGNTILLQYVEEEIERIVNEQTMNQAGGVQVLDEKTQKLIIELQTVHEALARDRDAVSQDSLHAVRRVLTRAIPTYKERAIAAQIYLEDRPSNIDRLATPSLQYGPHICSGIEVDVLRIAGLVAFEMQVEEELRTIGRSYLDFVSRMPISKN